ncbi:MAG TPA: kelch repeat-containing protein [Flavipsychrobacter sp.]|nr:kelch repeat-containing protein [Flavipsychrobacter sp.]
MKKLYTLVLAYSCLMFGNDTFSQTWTQKKDFADGLTEGAFSFTINDTIYVGGAGDTKFFKYDAGADKWTQMNTTPGVSLAREYAIAFAIDGKGYMALGNDSLTFKKDLWEYDPGTNAWTQKADFPGGVRAFAGCFVINNKAYVGGGYDTGIADPSKPAINDFWEYDPSLDKWAQKKNLPFDSANYYFPMSFNVGGKGYFVSGEFDTIEQISVTGPDTSYTYPSFVEIFPQYTFGYDPTTDTWKRYADFPGDGRSGGTAFVIDNKAYCGMGELNGDVNYNDLYIYDPAADKWSSLGASPMPARAYLLSASLSNGKAYLGTGINTTSNTYYKDWWELSMPTSTPEISSIIDEIVCYPNPATDNIYVRFPGNVSCQNCSYTLYNVLGRKVMSATGNLNSSANINIAGLPEGQYELKISSNERLYKTMISIIAH